MGLFQLIFDAIPALANDFRTNILPLVSIFLLVRSGSKRTEPCIILYPEDGSSTSFRNTVHDLPDQTPSHPRWQFLYSPW
jgi:hypothetical protein